MSGINICLIGAGIMGAIHARIYSEMKTANLMAIVDKDRAKADDLAGKYGVLNVYESHEEILASKEIQAVHIATPDFLHRDLVVAAVQAGKHVLVEKPLATTVEDARAIARYAEQSGCHVMVNYTHRWAAPYARAKKIIQSGEIGEAVMVYARKDDTLWAATEMMNWTAQTSPASYLSTHDIDLVLWFLETDVRSVYALGVKKVLHQRNIDTEDAIQALVRFENGAIGTFESCWVLPDSMPTVTDSFIEIIGTKGTIHIDRVHEGLKVAGESDMQWPKLSLNYEVNDKLHGGIATCLQYFIDSLLAGKKPQPDADSGLKIVRISTAIQVFIQKNAIIELKD